MKVYTTLIATLLAIALMTPTVSTQTDRQIDYTQMVEDIEIMCRIIDKNMKELFPKASHRTGILGRRGCQGFYLKNYGVIFTLEVQFPVTQKEIAVAPKKKQITRSSFLSWQNRMLQSQKCLLCIVMRRGIG